MNTISLTVILSLFSLVYSQATHDVQVGIQGLAKFFPDRLEVEPGDVVRFKFMDGTHTVTQQDPAKNCTKAANAVADFRQPVNTTAEYTFRDPGMNYTFFSASGDDCTNGMICFIKVKGTPKNSTNAITTATNGTNGTASNGTATNGTATNNGTAANKTTTAPKAPPSSTDKNDSTTTSFAISNSLDLTLGLGALSMVALI